MFFVNEWTGPCYLIAAIWSQYKLRAADNVITIYWGLWNDFSKFRFAYKFWNIYSNEYDIQSQCCMQNYWFHKMFKNRQMMKDWDSFEFQNWTKCPLWSPLKNLLSIDFQWIGCCVKEQRVKNVDYWDIS